MIPHKKINIFFAKNVLFIILLYKLILEFVYIRLLKYIDYAVRILIFRGDKITKLNFLPMLRER